MLKVPSDRRVLLAGAAAVALALVSAVVWVHWKPPIKATLWCGAMLTSFIGWGALVNRWLAPRKRMDWGMRAGWGMAFFVLSGGFVTLVHAAIRPVLIVHVGLGVVLLAADWALGPHRMMSSTHLRRRGVVLSGRMGLVALLLGAYALTVLTFFAFLGNHVFNPSDDPPFYFMLAEKLMQTGSTFEPFAARRVSLFCGQVYLNASFISVCSIYYLNVVDGGLAFAIVVALLVGLVGGRRLKAWQAVPLGLTLLVLFSLRDVRANTNSEMTGVAAILTLYRTVRVSFEPGRERPLWPMESRRIVALGALTLLPSLLRMSNAPAILMFSGLVFLFDFLLGTKLPWTAASWKPLLRAAGLSLGAFFFALLPWSILQKQSSGTYVYPFGHHNVTPGWTLLLKPNDLGQEGAELLGHLFYGKPLIFFIPFLVAGLVPGRGRARNDVASLALGSIIGFAVFSHQAVAFGAMDTARYYYAFVACTALVTAASVGRDGARAAIFAAALGMHLASSRDDIRGMFEGYVKNAFAVMHEGDKESMDYESWSAFYIDLQGHVPEGATIVTAVQEGFRFDFKRNPIYSLDVLGGMGPQPGWPVHLGPAVLADYLLANGVKYIIYVDWNLPSDFLNRDHWRGHLSRVGSYLQGEAVIQLDVEDTIDKLATTKRIAYQAHGMTVLDLTAPHGAS